MKRAFSLLLSLIIAATACLAMPAGAYAATAQTTVDLAQTNQTMNGFGASACWWAKDVGGWSNLDDILSLLYDDEKGIGLNIYRYNLGTDSVKDGLNYRGNRSTEAFINADGTYDWSKDANAQKALASAKKFAGKDMRVTLFCNSAPIYMTKNGCATANEYWWDCNLASDKYDAFADYGYRCADYFLNKGYRVTHVSPINEPYGHWCKEYEEIDGEKVYSGWAGQEGCYYPREAVRDVTKAFMTKFTESGNTVASRGCMPSLFEANDMNAGTDSQSETDLQKYLRCLFGKGGDFLIANAVLRKNIDTISMHSYWSSSEGKQRLANELKNTYDGKYSVAQTEYCQMSDDVNSGVYDLIQTNGMTSGLGIDYGIAMAKIIYDDLTILNAVEWDWWTAVAYGGYTDGLVYVNGDTHEIETSKRLYALGNFSKFTDEGSVRVGAATTSTDLKTVAFNNPDGTVSVVFINDTDAGINTALNINGITAPCYSYTSYVTDSTRNLAKYQSRTSSSSSVTVPANSVTTVVVKPGSHNYAASTKCATLSANGKTAYTCRHCGSTKSSTIYRPTSFKLSATSYTYDGKIKKPTVSVYNKAGSKISSSNYTVRYASGRKNVGKYAVKITFKGKYKGTKTLYFYIKPRATSISSISPGKRKFTVKWYKRPTQTSGYQIQYSTSSKFTSPTTRTISGCGTTSKTITKLKAKKKYFVRVRTYKTVNGTKYYSSWTKYKKVITKA